jgi:hypothetical protein
MMMVIAPKAISLRPSCFAVSNASVDWLHLGPDDRRETNSWRWPLFMVSYMLVLAYVVSLITYQGGHLLGFA